MPGQHRNGERKRSTLLTQAMGGTLCLMLLVVSLPAAQGETEGTTHWSWGPEGDVGDLALRLTIDFGAANDCLFRLQTARNTTDGNVASFYGRDDDSIVFHVAAYTEGWWNEASNHGGDADSDGWRAGDQGFIIQTLDLRHEGVETWIFAGYGTSVLDPSGFPSWVTVPDTAYRLDIACDAPFDVEQVEAATSLPVFGPRDTCELTAGGPVTLCGAAYDAGTGSLHLAGARNVVRYHQFSFFQDAGHVRMEGPNVSGEMTYASNGFMPASPGLRLEGVPGEYVYTFVHAGSAPYVVGGVAFPFDPVTGQDG